MWYRSLDGLKSDEINQHLPDIAKHWLGTQTRTAQGTRRVKPVSVSDHLDPIDYASQNLGKDIENFSQKSKDGILNLSNYLMERYKPQILDPYTQSRKIINNWNSNDYAQCNIAFQMAARDLFGLETAPLIQLTDVDSKTTAKAKAIYSKYGESMRDFLAKQYEHTQKSLLDLGISYIPLYRGMYISPDKSQYLNSKLRDNFKHHSTSLEPEVHDNVQIHLQPLSSHSLYPQMTTNFIRKPYNAAEGFGLMHRIEVPREKVFSHPYSGFGENTESELVTLGGNDYNGQAIIIPSRDIGRYKSDVIAPYLDPWIEESKRNNGEYQPQLYGFD